MGGVGMLTYFLGGWDTLTKAFILFLVLDYVSGVLGALYLGKLNSKIGFKGFIKKVMYIVLYVATVAAGEVLNQPNLHHLSAIAFIGNEFVSIIENCIECRLFIPKVVKERIKNFTDTEEEK